MAKSYKTWRCQAATLPSTTVQVNSGGACFTGGDVNSTNLRGTCWASSLQNFLVINNRMQILLNLGQGVMGIKCLFKWLTTRLWKIVLHCWVNAQSQCVRMRCKLNLWISAHRQVQQELRFPKSRIHHSTCYFHLYLKKKNQIWNTLRSFKQLTEN